MSQAEKAICGIDPHKSSITIGVVDMFGADAAVRSFANTGDGLQEALHWLGELP